MTGATHAGFLRIPATVARLPSTINSAAGQTRSNNAVVGLTGSATLAVASGQPAGTVGVILDVFASFE